FVVNLLMGEHTGARRTDLTGIEENSRRRGPGGGVEIGIIEDDIGGLAAELERHAFEIAGGCPHDSTADAGRSGKSDLVDIAVVDEGLAHHPPGAGDDVEHACRSPS